MYICIYMYIYLFIFLAVHKVPKWMNCHKATVVLTLEAYCFLNYTYILASCFCKTWALYVLWITYDHLYREIDTQRDKTTILQLQITLILIYAQLLTIVSQYNVLHVVNASTEIYTNLPMRCSQSSERRTPLSRW